jgi:hypothetical protein
MTAPADGVAPPADEQRDGPWNPGIESPVPLALLPLCTIFRGVNVTTPLAAAAELKGLTGLPLHELVAFRPERLALHELLIRVTADFEVPDGSKIEDLGINFREMARLLLARYVEPNMDGLIAEHRHTRSVITDAADSALRDVMPALYTRAASAPRSAPRRWFERLRRSGPKTGPAERGWGPRQIAELERLATDPEPAKALVCRTLARVLSALFTTHGTAWGTRDLIVGLTTDLAANERGSAVIGESVGALLRSASGREGMRLLPRQDRPVVINTKGASASGKSSLRPLQKRLAADIGVKWEDFALISPDIWRKQLLDYGSLGAAYKYAGAFTGEEVQIIDQKLDRYMARKHGRGDMSHLLIDRFRFDSFASDSDEAGSNLLTRFGQTVYLFFVITPPEQLVERAWNRGLDVGRYKALDDTLAHSVEAHTGIPDVFFTWVRRPDKQIRCEFLDNTVPFGERPRTMAFGDNDTLNILDVGGMLDIERFARIDVHARSPDALYSTADALDAARNTAFLRRCVAEYPRVIFADQASGMPYLEIEDGVPVRKDAARMSAAVEDADTRVGLSAVASETGLRDAAAFAVSGPLRARAAHPTLGQWGRRR